MAIARPLASTPGPREIWEGSTRIRSFVQATAKLAPAWTRPNDRIAPSFLVPVAGEMRLAQVEFALDPASRFVFQLAVAEKVVGLLPLGGDQTEFDLVVKLGELFVPVIAVAVMLDML